MSSLVNILSGGQYRSEEIPLIDGVLYDAVKPIVVSHAFECMVLSYCGMVAATAGCFSCAVDGELNGKYLWIIIKVEPSLVGRCCKLDKAGEGTRPESELSQ